MSDIRDKVKKEIETMKTNLPVELLEKILEQEIANGEKLDKLVELKETQVNNQAQFKIDWMKSKKRGTYFTGITFLLMSSAIALDVVQIEDLSIIIERVKLLLSAWGV